MGIKLITLANCLKDEHAVILQKVSLFFFFFLFFGFTIVQSIQDAQGRESLNKAVLCR